MTKKYIPTGNKDTRSGFGAGLLEAGKLNSNIMGLCADLTDSVKMGDFAKAFPDRFIQCGISEMNMIGVAAGLALSGKIPVASTFAMFATGHVYDQIRQSVAYSNHNVKICASHAGITLGEDGATHQIMEDIGLMKMLPNMVVINPCDYNQTKAATMAVMEYVGPVYLRFGRPVVPVFTPDDQVFKIGTAIKMIEGSDVSIFVTGHLVWEALQAAEKLETEGIHIEVINIHTIKPLDVVAILKSVVKTRAVVTAEEHMRNGGLGDSIAQLLALEQLAPIEMVAVDDKFGESGKPKELMDVYGLNAENIIAATKRVLKRKNK
ncbi:MAG: transketolase family protein [Prevotellaceae bacterium]|jgi:transketolase|nr:transketolase family protein [Prevotellaceae bacterium]